MADTQTPVSIADMDSCSTWPACEQMMVWDEVRAALRSAPVLTIPDELNEEWQYDFIAGIPSPGTYRLVRTDEGGS